MAQASSLCTAPARCRCHQELFRPDPMLPTIRFFFIMLIFTLLAGFFIVPTRDLPDNAVVRLDDQTQTYFPPGCADREKKDYRPATTAEARKLNYAPDKKCGDAKGFKQDTRSLSGNLMARLGMLPPLPSRWNADGSWNW